MRQMDPAALVDFQIPGERQIAVQLHSSRADFWDGAYF